MWKISLIQNAKLKYSWHNTHRDGIKVLTKHDRFYSPKIKGDH